MTNMEEILNQKSAEITRAPDKKLWIPRIDLKYAYGHLKLPKETSKRCSFATFGGNTNGYSRLKNKILRFISYTNNIPRKNRKNIDLRNNCVARGYNSSNKRDKDKQQEELLKILKQLQEDGYSASEN